MRGGRRDTELRRGLSDTQPTNRSQLLLLDPAFRPSEPPALCTSPLEPSQHTLPDSLPLELRDRPEDVHLQLPGWCSGVDPLRQTDERDAEHLELLQQRNQ